jgi:hypothetical protein
MKVHKFYLTEAFRIWTWNLIGVILFTTLNNFLELTIANLKTAKHFVQFWVWWRSSALVMWHPCIGFGSGEMNLREPDGQAV